MKNNNPSGLPKAVVAAMAADENLVTARQARQLMHVCFVRFREFESLLGAIEIAGRKLYRRDLCLAHANPPRRTRPRPTPTTTPTTIKPPPPAPRKRHVTTRRERLARAAYALGRPLPMDWCDDGDLVPHGGDQ